LKVKRLIQFLRNQNRNVRVLLQVLDEYVVRDHIELLLRFALNVGGSGEARKSFDRRGTQDDRNVGAGCCDRGDGPGEVASNVLPGTRRL
jgi:hypothetical protein